METQKDCKKSRSGFKRLKRDGKLEITSNKPGELSHHQQNETAILYRRFERFNENTPYFKKSRDVLVLIYV